jgi:hypothetical protein
MPFVIGVLGVDGESKNVNFRKAMAAPAVMPEFKGNVVAVETAPFWDDTIAALATPAGTGAITLRISGPKALEVLSELSPKAKPEGRKSHSAFLCRIYQDKKEVLDEALVTIFKSPASFNPDIALGLRDLKEKCKAYTQNS